MNNIRRKLIYVDDINYSLLSVKSRLKDYYEVYPAQSADTLYETLEKITPDIVLLDINMPEVSGYDIIKQLKSDARYADIPVIFLTSRTDKQSLIDGMKLGAVDFITKPFSDSEMIECIEMHCDSRKREFNKPIIVVIDDNPSILKTVNYLLKDKYVVRTLSDPVKTGMLLEKISPDLFLLDCNMPNLSGFDLVPIIRNTPGHTYTPIIFLTAEGTIDNISVAVQHDASDFIVKPIDEEILHKKIAAHLSDYLIHRRLRTCEQGSC